jgi:hypothetical protein
VHRESQLRTTAEFQLVPILLPSQLGHSVRPPSTLLPGQANVTQAEYEVIALAHMTEIWNNFGNLTEVWLGKPASDCA